VSPPPQPDDWRRQNQERFLKGRRWTFQTYREYREGWEHDHCEFCSEKFSLLESDLHQGYVTVDGYYWVCESCFADFSAEMEWIVNPQDHPQDPQPG